MNHVQRTFLKEIYGKHVSFLRDFVHFCKLAFFFNFEIASNLDKSGKMLRTGQRISTFPILRFLSS